MFTRLGAFANSLYKGKERGPAAKEGHDILPSVGERGWEVFVSMAGTFNFRRCVRPCGDSAVKYAGRPGMFGLRTTGIMTSAQDLVDGCKCMRVQRALYIRKEQASGGGHGLGNMCAPSPHNPRCSPMVRVMPTSRWKDDLVCCHSELKSGQDTHGSSNNDPLPSTRLIIRAPSRARRMCPEAMNRQKVHIGMGRSGGGSGNDAVARRNRTERRAMGDPAAVLIVKANECVKNPVDRFTGQCAEMDVIQHRTREIRRAMRTIWNK